MRRMKRYNKFSFFNGCMKYQWIHAASKSHYQDTMGTLSTMARKMMRERSMQSQISSHDRTNRDPKPTNTNTAWVPMENKVLTRAPMY